jgi:hypothetical protein
VNISPLKYTEKVLTTFVILLGVLGSCFDFFDIAQGTGNWIEKFSMTWALFFLIYCILSLTILLLLFSVIWWDQNYIKIARNLIIFRGAIRPGRWLIVFLVFIFPVWFFQFTVLGIVFHGIFIRLLIWAVVVFLVAFLSTEENLLVSWEKLLVTLILTASAFSIFSSLRFVSSYPFSLGWSEGNRLWDYSIMFWRDRYEYPSNQAIFVLLEPGRQFIGGIPFLIPGVTIKMVRIWVTLLDIFPYLLLGFASFRLMAKEKSVWIILSLWTYLFLNQGPIHSPLIISAFLVALAWRSSFWISIPLILLSGYYTNISRFTWVFAPAIWIMMLEFSDASPQENGRLKNTVWFRVIALFCSGILGGIFLPQIIKLLQVNSFSLINIWASTQNSEISSKNIQGVISNQSLLWYRLLPNSTYEQGILLGILLATGPLLFLLFHFVNSRQWLKNNWQKLSLFLPLSAFFLVGLVVSAKIGGGGDLHNMDMFFIGLLFCVAVAWNHGGRQWLQTAHQEPLWIRMILVAFLVILTLGPLQDMRSYNFIGRVSWLVPLTDAPNERALDMYPEQTVIDDSLKVIKSGIDKHRDNGEILFIDQRQLLTFGFITGVPLVPDYDKKVLIERALSSNREYFNHFYQDLKSHRFSLIITQPLNTPKKGSNDQFGEENNAWVKWVADPLLCFYQVDKTLLDVNVQLLIPKLDSVDCSKALP